MTEKLQKYHQENKIKDYMKLDLVIHETIWEACGNEFLSRNLIQLGEKYAFYCNNFISNSENPSSFLLIEDHIRLINAIKEKDGNTLKQILSLHWGKGLIE